MNMYIWLLLGTAIIYKDKANETSETQHLNIYILLRLFAKIEQDRIILLQLLAKVKSVRCQKCDIYTICIVL